MSTLPRAVACVALAAATIAVPHSATAYDPVPALRNLYGAPHAVAWLLQPKPGREAEFVDAMVTSGPYSKLLSGFANEKLLEPLPAKTGPATYICFSRYYDLGTERYVEADRMKKIRPLLVAEPRRIELELVEHVLADFGWERGKPNAVMTAGAFKHDEIFERNVSSLSFLKAGYVGQIGMLEFFEESADLADVRAKVGRRDGLSGASIFKIESGKPRYVVYSEFFRTPPELANRRIELTRDARPIGMQLGVVVQNYIPR